MFKLKVKKPQKSAKVLSIGIACVDLVNQVQQFPIEDSDKRGAKYYWQRGGNANNTCTVLTLLSTPCDFMGALGTIGPEASWLLEDFEKFGISLHHCVFKESECPVSTIILSQDTGTRTIIHHPRNVDKVKPILTFEDFDQSLKGDFSQYSWIHFELTSNVSDVCCMIESVLASQNSSGTKAQPQEIQSAAKADQDHKLCAEMEMGLGSEQTEAAAKCWRPIVSVEIEKPEYADAEQVMNKADVVFISKDFAMSRGYKDGCSAVEGMFSLCKPRAILFCAWGEKGATAGYRNDTKEIVLVNVPASADIICDTLGAGDTFIAAVIHKLVKEGSGFGIDRDVPHSLVKEVLKYGCLVAGVKCGLYGFESITNFVSG